MIWLGIFIGIIIGAAAGAALYRQFMSDAVKVQALEDEIDNLRREHQAYQHQVHAHFDTSASLFKTLTGNYRDLYQHLAGGARQLCPETVYSQLSNLTNSNDILSSGNSGSQRLFDADGNFAPPRDYAEKSDPAQKGNLSEDYGLKKIEPRGESAA